MKAIGIHIQNKEFTARPQVWVSQIGNGALKTRYYRPTQASRQRLARFFFAHRRDQQVYQRTGGAQSHAVIIKKADR